MNPSKHLVRGLAASAILVSCTAAVMAPQAHAAPADPVTGSEIVAPASIANIDPATPRSLTIHKYAQPATPTGLAHDGTAVDPADLTDLTPLSGVKFRVQQVTDVNLTTQAGWDSIKDLTAAQVMAGGHTLDAGTEVTTVDGAATLNDLPIGLYLVQETDRGIDPATGEPNPITRMAEPFLVTLPTAHNADATWVYDVNAYPKNSVSSVDKTVDDSMAHALGDTVMWHVTAAVPHEPEGRTVSKFVIDDPIDSRLGLDAVTVTLADANGTDVALDAADYTVTPNLPAAAADGVHAVVTFTDSGLAKLSASQGGTVSVDLATTVTALGADGILPDQATVFIDDDNVGLVTPEVDTRLGALEILKNAQEDTTKVLSGADFQVFGSEADAQARTNPISVDVNGQATTTFTTGDNGLVLVPGLKVDSPMDDNNPGPGTDYWIVETKAPVGYQNNFTPIKVTVTVGGLDQAVRTTVSDAQVPTFMLPLTGGAGTTIFAMGGLAAVAGAATIAIMATSRRRRSQEAVD